MEKVQKLYRHPLYQECLEKNKKAEETRIFCKHGMEHLMDVARIAYILSVDGAYAISKEIIYAAALLHDIGKWKQYEDGTPHEKASADLAEQILEASGFSEEDQAQVLDAILKHRKKGKQKEENPLAELLYDADKLSRVCYACEVRELCDWSEEKKNHNIVW